ncbi:acyl-CoA desaturase [Kineococcus radiotolerans]|nr:acyl-CoA desaturase [Kineococcus radiotolerans]
MPWTRWHVATQDAMNGHTVETHLTRSPETGTLTPAGAEPRPAARPQGAKLYQALAQQVRERGLMRRRPGWYVLRAAALLAVLGAVAVASWNLGDTWWQLLLAPVVAVVVSQVAFLGHDAAHQQVFGSPRANEVAARGLASGWAGLSYGWWLGKHGVHHSAPNQRGRDTDIESKALAFYPEAVEGKSRLHAWLLRRQGFLFFPLLLLEGLNLHVDSARNLTSRAPRPRRAVDISLVVVRWALYLAFAGAVMSPLKVLAFVAVDLACFGVLLGGAFAPNHTGMPILARGAKLDFLHRQVTSSRNVSGGWWVDLVMGGLNHQVEHHLFPSMPRPTLRKVRPIVRDFCAGHGIPYTETSFVGAFRAVVVHLNTVGLAGRRDNSCPLAAQLRS